MIEWVFASRIEPLIISQSQVKDAMNVMFFVNFDKGLDGEFIPFWLKSLWDFVDRWKWSKFSSGIYFKTPMNRAFWPSETNQIFQLNAFVLLRNGKSKPNQPLSFSCNPNEISLIALINLVEMMIFSLDCDSRRKFSLQLEHKNRQCNSQWKDAKICVDTEFICDEKRFLFKIFISPGKSVKPHITVHLLRQMRLCECVRVSDNKNAFLRMPLLLVQMDWQVESYDTL